MRTRSRRRSPGSGAHSPSSPGPWILALRRLRRDRAALVFGALVLMILLALLAAPLYASEVAHTAPSENHLTDTTVIDGKPTDVLSLDGVPIGPTWHSEYFLGADENGRDLMVRVLYGARASVTVGAGAVVLSLLLAVPLALLAGYRRGRTDALITRLFDLYVEVIFGLPGVGAMTANTIGTFDLPPVIALAMYLALVVVLASALVDIAVAWLDPRIRRSPA